MEKETTFSMDTPLFVKCNGKLERVMPRDIVCLEADRTYCNLYVAGRKNPYNFYIPMGHVYKTFPADFLLAVGRSHRVNINHIQAIGTNSLHMDNGLELQGISKTGMDAVRQHIHIIG